MTDHQLGTWSGLAVVGFIIFSLYRRQHARPASPATRVLTGALAFLVVGVGALLVSGGTMPATVAAGAALTGAVGMTLYAWRVRGHARGGDTPDRS